MSIINEFTEVHEHVHIALEVPLGFTIRGDTESLRQMVEELFGNASTAMRESGTIRVQVGPVSSNDDGEASHAKVCLAIEDNGPGISPEVAETLFNPFVSTFAIGTGLGLAFARNVVGAHGGRLWQEPVVPHGARFVILLPHRFQGD